MTVPVLLIPAAVVVVVVIEIGKFVALKLPVLEYPVPVCVFVVIKIPPAPALIACAPWVKPTPDPLPTALIVTPNDPARLPADKAPLIVIAFVLTAAFAGSIATVQPRQVLSNTIEPGTAMAPPIEIAAPLVTTA